MERLTMLDLDALIGKYERVKIDGKEYDVPVGMDSLTLQAVAVAKQAMVSIAKLSKADEELTDDDVLRIHKFVSASTSIPIDTIGKCSVNVLTKIIELMIPGKDEKE
jgi:hypothetical protein